jgi:hypothetical protein
MITRYEQLHEKYPFIRCSISIGEGWLDLFDELMSKIDDLIKNKYSDMIYHPEYEIWEENGYYITTIKEKFGMMTIYMFANDEILDLIDEYQKKSLTICESCGTIGKLVCHGYWYTTLCEGCERIRYPNG